MQNAAEPCRTPDFLENVEAIGPRVAAVNDDRQLCVTGERKLVAKFAILNVTGRMIVKVVEADLAPGDHFRMLRERRELIEMLLHDFLRLVRMDTHGSEDPIVLLGKRERSIQLPGTRACADGEERRYSGGSRAIEHR